MRLCLLVGCLASSLAACGQVTVTIDLNKPTHSVSPYLYGRNNSLSGDPGTASKPEWTKLKDAGVRFFREGGGNNSTKYNWRLKISSHADWYNNVYANDWSFAAKALQTEIPSAQGMWSFQLIGRAAATNAHNFNDWAFNGSQWWEGVAQNLAGGGEPDASGGTRAAVEGDPRLYLQDWTADSTTLILDHWFDELGLRKETLRYWSMDNEPEIWHGTHDDVIINPIPAEEFMQRYFAVARKAREKYPEIKLLGPVPANEWQWYNWALPIISDGRSYPWLEYFIKRVAEEQEATGMRLLDVLDIHFYPSSTNSAQIVQYHRIYFDKNYVYPEANGVKNLRGSWNAAENKEYILQRCKEWLATYMGDGHGVTFSVSEIGIPEINAKTSAVWYAGTLGEFMRHPEMEIFAPWSWHMGMWEVLHLFSRYNKTEYVQATSTDEEFVSAYPTLNTAGDSLTVVLVNRGTSSSRTVTLSLMGFDLADEAFETLTLANLPEMETFVSHTHNALQKGSIAQRSNAISASIPAMSLMTIRLKGQRRDFVTDVEQMDSRSLLNIFPNPVSQNTRFTMEVGRAGHATLEVLDLCGRVVSVVHSGPISAQFSKEVDLTGWANGLYVVRLRVEGVIAYARVSVVAGSTKH